MDSIFKQLTSFEWWFTVVFVAIVVSIVSSYAKDWITSALSSLSSKYRKQAEVRTTARNMEIERLSTNSEMLIVEYVRTGFCLIKVIAVIVGSAIFPIWTALQKNYPEIDPLTHLFGWPPITFGLPIQGDLTTPILSLILSVYGIIELNEFLNRYTLCEKARVRILSGKN